MTEQEQISVFDMFKIGIGPSSSHTLGPWRAAKLFLESLEKNGFTMSVCAIQVHLFGSLAKTGKGHGTDIAIELGLCDFDPVTFDVNSITPTINEIARIKKLNLASKNSIAFDPAKDLLFHFSESLPYHPNAMTLKAKIKDGSDFEDGRLRGIVKSAVNPRSLWKSAVAAIHVVPAPPFATFAGTTSRSAT